VDTAAGSPAFPIDISSQSASSPTTFQALRRPGTQTTEIKVSTIKKIGAVIGAWQKLQRDLRKRMTASP
jgi:hypothetical protein